MAHHSILERGAVASLTELNAQVDARRKEVGTLERKIELLKTAQTTLNIEKTNALTVAREQAKQQRLDNLMTYFDSNPKATLTAAAGEIGVSRQTVSNYVTELKAAGKLDRNGTGWEVAG